MFNYLSCMKPMFKVAFIFFFTVSLSCTQTSYGGTWSPIIGIPQPEFGVNDIAPTRPTPWNAAIPGYYYVCPTCSGSTDTYNTYGYPSKPRATIPSTSVSAGSVIEIGGQYDSTATISLLGTQANPIFIRGIDYPSRPTITSNITITGEYLIFENLKSGPSNPADTTFNFSIKEGANHIAIRNCEFEGNLNKAGGIAVGSWSYSGTASASYILLDNLYIHDLGDPNTTIDQDAHGVNVNGSVDHLWLTHSELARTTGDGIQLEAQQGRRDKIHHVYIGDNHSHHNKQTGMWIKHASDIIISQNTIDGHRDSNSSYGQGTGFQYGPEYVWFLFNKIYDNEVGIGISSNDPPGDGTEAYYIGNLIYNIHASDLNRYNSGTMMIRGGTNHYIINNTFHDVDAGINVPAGGTLNFQIFNNIFSSRTQAGEYDFYAGGLSTTTLHTSQLDNNIFYSSSGPRINWGGTVYTNLSLFQASGEGQNNLSSDPLFINPASNTNDYRLQSSSPARDSGVAHAAYSTFLTRYGIDISKDLTRKPRPMGKGKLWDRGAHEYLVISTPTLK